MALKRLGTRIREIRKRLRLNQEEVSHQAGMGLSFYAEVERGIGNPSVETLVKIANALGVSFTELLVGEELDRFEDVNRLLKGVPAAMRPLILKAFADVANLVKDTERVVKARYER